MTGPGISPVACHRFTRSSVHSTEYHAGYDGGAGLLNGFSRLGAPSAARGEAHRRLSR
jgi:hypothetical protein